MENVVLAVFEVESEAYQALSELRQAPVGEGYVVAEKIEFTIKDGMLVEDENVKDGTVKAFALWDPEQLGYLAAYTADALASGDIEGKEGDTFEAGRLGEYTVEADGVVVLGEPFVFDKSNIDDFDF